MKKIFLFFTSVKESIDSIRSCVYRIQYLLECLNSKVETAKIDE